MNAEAGFQLSDLAGVARRRAGVMGGVALLVVLAFYWVAMALPNQYESYATVLVEPQSVSADLVKAGVRESDLTQRLHLMTAEILSRPRLSRLIDQVVQRRPGLRLLTAADGAAGLAQARRHRPDLVLLDLHLPDLDGEEVLRRLRQESDRTPVVVISADATPARVERLRRAGAAAYLTKPIDVHEFLATVDRLLTREARS